MPTPNKITFDYKPPLGDGLGYNGLLMGFMQWRVFTEKNGEDGMWKLMQRASEENNRIKFEKFL